MATDPPTAPSPGDVLLLVGTMKGAFLVWSTPERREWHTAGPHFRGETVYAMAFDQRGGRRRVLAGTQSFHWGSVVRTSDDYGATWSEPDRQNVRFPEDSGLAVANIWQLRPGLDSEPDVVYCGVEPAALFASHDAGESFTPVEGLLSHEHRAKWTPGGGGLCLHTIVLDPSGGERMGVAISTGGFYRSDDGGASWRARNAGVRAEFLPDKYPEFGQCVHKVAASPDRPDQLFAQNHGGVFRSDDWGTSWTSIADGLPSDFGFPVVAHPRRPGTAWLFPLVADADRRPATGRLEVYRTDDAGAAWTSLHKGLPGEPHAGVVLRDAMCADDGDPASVYFGTRTGEVYAGADEGATWTPVAEHLPDVLSLRAARIG